ncbi:hypothetical protein V6N11_019356 [Hibiscus sabdariffa]|uniref:Peptidylprolyl isomerase n=1 Tax=Hibiscus sabdariffa TaxID=183260 RepID=A0ABR2R2F7_9ROSI
MVSVVVSRLTGRAVVELTIEKGDDEVGGEPRKTAFSPTNNRKVCKTGKDGELPVLPLSIYGAVAMAHSDVSEEYSSPYQIFFYLYGKRNTYHVNLISTYKYTTVEREILPQIRTEDVIKFAKLVEDQDHLVLPNES